MGPRAAEPGLPQEAVAGMRPGAGRARRAFALLAAGLAALLAAALLRGLSPSDDTLLSGDTQGTTYSIKIAAPLGEAEHRRVEETIAQRLDRIDRVLSLYREDSELSRFNRLDGVEPVPASTDLIEVFQMARTVSEVTGGAFDVTVAPLVAAWDFGPASTGDAKAPSDAALAELRGRVGYEKIEVDAARGALRKMVAGVTCDLNAIAQGYTVDRLAADLLGLGYQNFVVEVGGEVCARGHNTRGIPWQVAIEKPVFDGREVEQVIPLDNMALSTSGDYRNYREKDGVRLSHLIDPHSGRPVTHHLASVSVLHSQCALADAWATALMVMGPQMGYDLALSQGLAVLFISSGQDTGFVTRATPEFERLAGNGGQGTAR